MCFLHIHAQSHSRLLEVLPEETEYAELVVEDAVSHVLLKLFGEAMVDEVAVDFSAASHTGLLHCSIQIHAQCSCQSFTLPQHTKERMKLAVEEGMCSLLKELFGPVKVDSVTLGPSPWNCWNDSALSRSI